MGHPYRIREIAVQAGLSERTVDRVLNNRGQVRESTVREVHQAIADLDRQRSQLRLSGRICDRRCDAGTTAVLLRSSRRPRSGAALAATGRRAVPFSLPRNRSGRGPGGNARPHSVTRLTRSHPEGTLTYRRSSTPAGD